jgi:hypothetical protein
MLDDAAWTSIASMVASAGALGAVLVGNRRGRVIEKKVDTGVETVTAVQHSVTTPDTDSRTMAAIVSAAHPEQAAPS